MFFPTPWTVGVKTYSAGATDAHGNPVDSWSDPVEAPVYGWSPPDSRASTEPFALGRDITTWDLDLYVPADFWCNPKDRIVVLGREYVLEGHVEDYNHGPFGYMPGARIRLRSVEG